MTHSKDGGPFIFLGLLVAISMISGLLYFASSDKPVPIIYSTTQSRS